uniref:VHL domain-containing protein n=1 Tax=Caenorhabditis tropicalis TaxID=1561998 RepID=A0A1I7T0R6_9PELO
MTEEESDFKLFPDVGTGVSDNRDIRVRFMNRCGFVIDLFWLNENKKPTKFGQLKANQYLDIRTYQNHPWVARKTEDGSKLKMNNKPVYWPQPVHKNIIRRDVCQITAKVQTLKELASRSLLHQNPKIASKDLDNLPRDLQFEVKNIMNNKKEYREIVCAPPPSSNLRALRPPPENQ